MGTTPSEVVIVVDTRERGSGVLTYLEGRAGVTVELARLPIADFLCGDGVAVERKSARDFVGSILDRRLFDQADRLAVEYERPMLILEGDPFDTGIGVHPNAIRGALAHLAVRRMSVLPSPDPEGTAELLVALARQVQGTADGRPRMPAKRRASALAERQVAVAAALPGVGPVLAQRLLAGAGSLAGLAAADPPRLRQVPGIGPRRAAALAELLTAPYPPAADGAGTAKESA